MANAEKLRRLVQVIRDADERGEFDMTGWAEKDDCGTKFCGAGWQCVIEGQEPEWYVASYTFPETHYAAKLKSGSTIRTYAQQSLGLTFHEAQMLFLDPTTVDEFAYYVECIIEGKVPYANTSILGDYEDE